MHMKYYTGNFRDRYTALYTNMDAARIASIFDDTSELYLDFVDNSIAEAEVLRQEDAQWYSYPVTFARELGGRWGMYGY